MVNKISDLGNDMVDELDKVLNIVKEAERDPSAFQTKEQKEKNNIDDNPSALWQALEPAFALHDRIARWLLESESSVDLNVPWLSEAMDNIHKYIDEFVYQYLSRFIQPAIQEMRKAVAAGREQILADEQKLDKEKDIYTDGSINSDPSHSIIAKDHFSNCLNPAAVSMSSQFGRNYLTDDSGPCGNGDY
ncbi:hypothetical protein H2203_003795 [Taxawa tesnikishii (nom. ined.)]|nr:hypothetical protein H2203_003795 [Dothideales sp. JES 119]